MPVQTIDHEDENVRIATARLAQEAKLAFRYGVRGVSDITEQFTVASNGNSRLLQQRPFDVRCSC